MKRRQIPVDRSAQAGIEGGRGLEAEALLGPRNIQAAARLPVRPVVIPYDAPLEPRQQGDFPGQFFDGNFLAAAQVDRFGAVVTFGSRRNSRGRVFYVEKFPRGRSIAPANQLM